LQTAEERNKIKVALKKLILDALNEEQRRRTGRTDLTANQSSTESSATTASISSTTNAQTTVVVGTEEPTVAETTIKGSLNIPNYVSVNNNLIILKQISL